ncbi:MAG TPA: OsmC family protein [Nitrospiraceae bacterium]|nr:OsmC family protein [Nitrospiraceae bacterium]
MNWEALCRSADQWLFRRMMINQQTHKGESITSQGTISHAVNGVDVGRLGETVEAVRQQPSLAAFQFRAANRWIGGGHNRSTIQGFYGAGEEDRTRATAFVLDADEPPVLLGKDQGANPVEFVLHALAACLTTSVVYHAAARAIRIDSVESRLEGDLDLRGFLGASDQVRRGYQQIRVQFQVASDAVADELQQLTTYSPVFDILSNPVPVSVSIEVQRSKA